MTPGRKALVLVAAADAVRLAGAAPLGLGDAEALYATYAAHPQGGYLDHPPLIGWVDRVVLSVWPSAFALRVAAVLLFTLSAWLLFRLARSLFTDRAAFAAVAILCLAPVFHLGGLAAAPDAPLAPLWIAWLGAAWKSFERGPDRSSGRTVAQAAALGALLGAAFLAKYSAFALVPVGVAVAWRLGRARRILAIAAAAAAAAIVALPVAIWNADHGFVSLAHRLSWSQPDPGLSLRNLGALVGGQFLYLSPLVAIGLAWTVGRGWRERSSARVRFCLLATLVPLAALSAVCLWSRVAEPHWPAPAFFALLPLAGHFVAEGTRGPRRFATAAGVVAVAMNATVYVAVLTPVLPVLVPEPAYVAKWDIVNELYGWDLVADAVRRRVPVGGAVVAGHYTMCAQLAWNLRGSGIPVRCRTREITDFDLWDGADCSPVDRPVVFVSDERYPARPEGPGGTAPPDAAETVVVRRGGVVVRTFALTSYPAGAVSSCVTGAVGSK